ncbi:S-layer homology domain-containing protein [Paenibacillus marinisediminis]
MYKKLISLVLMFVILVPLTPEAQAASPTLEAPSNLKVQLFQDADSMPIFHLTWDNPQSVKAQLLEAQANDGKYTMVVHVDYSYKGKPYISEKRALNEWGAGQAAETTTAKFKPEAVAGDHFKATDYTFRVFYVMYSNETNEYTASPFSNTVSFKPVNYSHVSNWAVHEVKRAEKYGLITESIKDNLNSPITREEFAELAARLYEVYMNKPVTPAPAGTFIDTNNSEVLKAYKLGIINGIGNNKFEPNGLTNREQVATMLSRAIQVMAPNADYSTAGAPEFADDDKIAPYFINNVKYMAKHEYVKGMDGHFDPQGNCTREMAVLIAVRIYEAHKK